MSILRKHQYNFHCSTIKEFYYCIHSVVHVNLINHISLLGCPVVLCSAAKLDLESFHDLPMVQKQYICASLFHCLNWFRELISSTNNVHICLSYYFCPCMCITYSLVSLSINPYIHVHIHGFL